MMGSMMTRRRAIGSSLAVLAGPGICAASGGVCCQTPAAPAAAIRRDGRRILIDVARAGGLDSRGAAMRVADGPLDLIVVRTARRGFAVLDAKCTHGGGALTYVPKRNVLHCTCWGHSEFDLGGAVVEGPAKRKLPRYSAAFDGRTLTIETEPAL
jgi:Rieske Fe-S protein